MCVLCGVCVGMKTNVIIHAITLHNEAVNNISCHRVFFSLFLSVWFPSPENYIWKKRYLNGFFIFVQDMIERAMVEEIVGERVSSPGLYFQQMPYPCYRSDAFSSSLILVLPLTMLFAWLFPVAMTVRSVVNEKQTRLKEFMKMMGVGEGLLRLSWFINSFGVFFVSVVGITLLLKLGGVLLFTNGLILLLYLTLYAVVLLSYSFFVSAFFNNANLAACVAALVYFLVFFAHMTLVTKMTYLSPITVGICVSTYNVSNWCLLQHDSV